MEKAFQEEKEAKKGGEFVVKSSLDNAYRVDIFALAYGALKATEKRGRRKEGHHHDYAGNPGSSL